MIREGAEIFYIDYVPPEAGDPLDTEEYLKKIKENHLGFEVDIQLKEKILKQWGKIRKEFKDNKKDINDMSVFLAAIDQLNKYAEGLIKQKQDNKSNAPSDFIKNFGKKLIHLMRNNI